jgi:hypothetical protein
MDVDAGRRPCTDPKSMRMTQRCCAAAACAQRSSKQERGSAAELQRIGSEAEVLYTSPDRKAANHSHTPVASLFPSNRNL